MLQQQQYSTLKTVKSVGQSLIQPVSQPVCVCWFTWRYKGLYSLAVLHLHPALPLDQKYKTQLIYNAQSRLHCHCCAFADTSNSLVQLGIISVQSIVMINRAVSCSSTWSEELRSICGRFQSIFNQTLQIYNRAVCGVDISGELSLQSIFGNTSISPPKL